VALFGALFAARTDVYAVRWENTRTGKAGWLPAVRGGWRKGVPHADRDYLPLTAAVLASHLSGDQHIGFYPLLDGDRCWWLADFDGPAAMLDALAYLKAARSMRVPAALEVSRSGVGAHAWCSSPARSQQRWRRRPQQPARSPANDACRGLTRRLARERVVQPRAAHRRGPRSPC
jgi:hypothetical protein